MKSRSNKACGGALPVAACPPGLRHDGDNTSGRRPRARQKVTCVPAFLPQKRLMTRSPVLPQRWRRLAPKPPAKPSWGSATFAALPVTAAVLRESLRSLQLGRPL